MRTSSSHDRRKIDPAAEDGRRFASDLTAAEAPASGVVVIVVMLPVHGCECIVEPSTIFGSRVLHRGRRDGETFDAADDGSNWLSSLIARRADIASGDDRALYLGWLLDVQCGEIDDNAVEPARPEGLANLTPALDT